MPYAICLSALPFAPLPSLHLAAPCSPFRPCLLYRLHHLHFRHLLHFQIAAACCCKRQGKTAYSEMCVNCVCSIRIYRRPCSFITPKPCVFLRSYFCFKTNMRNEQGLIMLPKVNTLPALQAHNMLAALQAHNMLPINSPLTIIAQDLPPLPVLHPCLLSRVARGQRGRMPTCLTTIIPIISLPAHIIERLCARLVRHV